MSFIYIDENVRFFSTSEDGNAIAYKWEKERADQQYEFKAGTPLIGSSVHPIKYLAIFAGKDGSFSLHDLRKVYFIVILSL